MSGIFGGGGGGQAPAPSSQTVTQTSIPEYARPYVERTLGKAEALSETPYQAYGGQRLAGFTPLQQQAFQSAAGMQPSATTGQGVGFAGLGALRGLGAGQDYFRMATSPMAQQAFMSPYVQNVIDVQKQEAVRDYQKGLGSLGARAAASGAFGGTRAALERAEAGRNLATQLGNIQATGLQNAFQQAQQAQQFGSTLGMQGVQSALQGAGILGTLGGQQFQQGMDINKLQQATGATQQAAEQQQLDMAYQDFLRQRNYPYTQLGFMSDMLRGLPLSQASQQIYQAPPSPLSQIAGLGLGAYGMSRMFKEGGIVKMADGGSVPARITGQMNPQEVAKKLDYVDSSYLMRLLQDPQVDPMTKALAQKELESRPRQSMPQPSTAGLPALSIGDMYEGMAGGGIVAFNGEDGSAVQEPNAYMRRVEAITSPVKTLKEWWSSLPSSEEIYERGRKARTGEIPMFSGTEPTTKGKMVAEGRMKPEENVVDVIKRERDQKATDKALADFDSAQALFEKERFGKKDVGIASNKAAPKASPKAEPSPQEKLFSSYEKMLMEDRAAAKQLREDAKTNAILQAAGAMLSSDSPYFTKALGQATGTASKGYQEALSQLRKEDRESRRELMDIEKSRADVDYKNKLLRIQELAATKPDATSQIISLGRSAGLDNRQIIGLLAGNKDTENSARAIAMKAYYDNPMYQTKYKSVDDFLAAQGLGRGGAQTATVLNYTPGKGLN